MLMVSHVILKKVITASNTEQILLNASRDEQLKLSEDVNSKFDKLIDLAERAVRLKTKVKGRVNLW